MTRAARGSHERARPRESSKPMETIHGEVPSLRHTRSGAPPRDRLTVEEKRMRRPNSRGVPGGSVAARVRGPMRQISRTSCGATTPRTLQAARNSGLLPAFLAKERFERLRRLVVTRPERARGRRGHACLGRRRAPPPAGAGARHPQARLSRLRSGPADAGAGETSLRRARLARTPGVSAPTPQGSRKGPSWPNPIAEAARTRARPLTYHSTK
jgi:hypothetical protein